MIWEKLPLFWSRHKDEEPREDEAFIMRFECVACGIQFLSLTAWRAHQCGG